MNRMVQLRNVPEDLHRRLKARAALAGMSMSEWLVREIEEILARPTRAELLDRIAALPPVTLSFSPADAIREARDQR